MRLSIFSSLLLFISLLSLFHTPTFAEKKTYIVYLGSHDQRRSNAPFATYDDAVKYHYELLGSCLGSINKAKSSIFYSYSRFINGFAAVLSEEDAIKVKNHPKVISVFENRGKKVQTTHSWDYLGLEKDNGVPLNSAWNKARFGEDIIIGILDYGVWPELKSFSDEGMGPVPIRWRGTCQTNNRDGIKCNRKLIGVRQFNRGFLKTARRVARRQNTTYVVPDMEMTARDYDGHGTHTASTAGGNFVPNVNISGYSNVGTAKGGAPRARLAVYRVCGLDPAVCPDADVLAGIEAAISDGVDVISISLGSGVDDFFEDGNAIGSFHAVKNGIVVVAAAGNSGPTPGSVVNVAPWIFTVGASTTNREFVTHVTLGNKQVIKGVGLSEKSFISQKFYPLITGADARANDAPLRNASKCDPGTLDPKKVNGKILVCFRLEDKDDKSSETAAEVGAVGLILANDEKYFELVTGVLPIPFSFINFTDGQSVFAYIRSTKTPVAHISNGQIEFNIKRSPAIPSISSRGPNMLDPAILKPDVTAPGTNIIAGFVESLSPNESTSNTFRAIYARVTGTSMACPHVSGIAALVKSVHRDWSPAAIRSAIMTTASAKDRSSNPIVAQFNNLEATPFAYGAGNVNPNSAMDPGLVYDLNDESYLNYLCARGYNQSVIRPFTISEKNYSCPNSFKIEDLNYPSIVVPSLNGSIVVTRYLKNVGSPGTYNVSVKAPAGVSISIEPSSLKFEKYGEEKKFAINFTSNVNDSPKDYVFGELIWSDNSHNVRSPIVVKKG